MILHTTIRYSPAKISRLCKHCQKQFESAYDEFFCCHGCHVAFDVVKELGLLQFYHILSADGHSLAPIATSKVDFTLLDEFQSRSTSCVSGSKQAIPEEITLNVDGLHCFACCWLIEKAIQQEFSGCVGKVNLATRQLRLSWSAGGFKPSQIAAFLQKFGYTLTISGGGVDAAVARDEIVRLGVAWFCSLNIMLLAFADYVSGDMTSAPAVSLIFHALQAALGSVVVTYCAWPFYRNAWQNLRVHRLTIDAPISLAILVTYLVSTVSLFSTGATLFFDSLTAVVALLLTGRQIQARLLRTAEGKLRESSRASDGHCRVHRLGVLQWTRHREILSGDQLDLYPGELVPVNGRVLSSAGEISLGALTGEFRAYEVKSGDPVRSGSMNGATPILIEATEDGMDSSLRATQTLSSALIEKKGRFATLTDWWGKWFLLLVPVVSLLTFLAWYPSVGISALNHALAVLLVACPCAIGLASPLVFARASSHAFSSGFLFRSQRAVEAASRCQKVYFDKTGTLTVGDLTVRDAQWDLPSLSSLRWQKEDALNWLSFLTARSAHQAAKSIYDWANAENAKTVRRECAPSFFPGVFEIREEFGQGLQLKTAEVTLWLGKDQTDPGNQSTIFKVNDRTVITFNLDDSILENAHALVLALQRRGLAVSILSGDHPERTQKVANQLGVPVALGSQSPLNKALLVAKSKRCSAVVGNGFNDIPAFAKSPLSIAVRNSPSSVREASDIYLFDSNIGAVAQVFDVAQSAVSALKRAIAMALLYNSIGIFLAVAGYVTPLAAAILMPISSGSVIFLATRWGPKSRRLSRERG